MKDMRRLATRFEKTPTNFRSMLYLFAARCWANCVHTLVFAHAVGLRLLSLRHGRAGGQPALQRIGKIFEASAPA